MVWRVIHDEAGGTAKSRNVAPMSDHVWGALGFLEPWVELEQFLVKAVQRLPDECCRRQGDVEVDA